MTDGPGVEILHGMQGTALFNSLKLRFLRFHDAPRGNSRRGGSSREDNDVRRAKKFYFRLPGKTR